MDFTNLINEITNQIDAARMNGIFDAEESLQGMLTESMRLKNEERDRQIKLVTDAENIYVELLELLANGPKLNAIKRWREISGWSLVAAKNFVDELDKAGKIGENYHKKDKFHGDTMKFYAQLALKIRNGDGEAVCFVYDNTDMNWAEADEFVREFDKM